MIGAESSQRSIRVKTRRPAVAASPPHHYSRFLSAVTLPYSIVSNRTATYTWKTCLPSAPRNRNRDPGARVLASSAAPFPLPAKQQRSKICTPTCHPGDRSMENAALVPFLRCWSVWAGLDRCLGVAMEQTERAEGNCIRVVSSHSHFRRTHPRHECLRLINQPRRQIGSVSQIVWPSQPALPSPGTLLPFRPWVSCPIRTRAFTFTHSRNA